MIDKYIDRIFEYCKDVMDKKNTDYGDSWKTMRRESITDQIIVKAMRIKTLETSKSPPKVSEGIESELTDIMNYCVFRIAKEREITK